VKKKKKIHPVYAATHSAWSGALASPTPEGREYQVRRLFLEIAHNARQHLVARGKPAKTHHRHTLAALLDVQLADLARAA